MKRLNLWLTLLTILSRTGGVQAQTPPWVDLVTDLLEVFDPAQVSTALECGVRRPQAAGGVPHPALFEHPLKPDVPARVDYRLQLPQAAPGEQLLLAFAVGIADGASFQRGEDGVRFVIEIEGARIFSRESRECRWEAHALELNPWAGRRIQLALLTEAMGNTAHDWACWALPRVLHFRGRGGSKSTAVTTGSIAAAVSQKNPGTLTLTALGTGETLSLKWPAAATKEPTTWLVQDFRFPKAQGVEVAWEPPEALSLGDLWIGAYRGQPKIQMISADRAIISSGETVKLRAEIKNAGQGKLAPGEAQLEFAIDPQAKKGKGNQRAERLDPTNLSVPELEPGETWRGEVEYQTPNEPAQRLGNVKLTAHGQEEVGKLALRILDQPNSRRNRLLQNDFLRFEFVRLSDGFGYVKVHARDQQSWRQMGVWSPLMRVVIQTGNGEQEVLPRPRRVVTQRDASGQIANLAAHIADQDGVEWEAGLEIELAVHSPLARIRYSWKASKERDVLALWGPNLYPGDGTFGEAKSWGLFPGLEYLFGPERSSNPRDFSPPLNDRRTPHPHKITIPLMAITVGPESRTPPVQPGRFFAPDSLKDFSISNGVERRRLFSTISGNDGPSDPFTSSVSLGLMWDPWQRWDGEHSFPSARFASPNFDEGMQNHRMGLFLPSVPDYAAENSAAPTKPFRLMARKELTLEAFLVAVPGPAMSVVREWFRLNGGVPSPGPWPRSFQAELDICRAGFLETVWDADRSRWRHCIGWPSSHAPGFAALVWLDAQLAEAPEARRRSREHVDRVARLMLQEGGPAAFTSEANCHILKWEFPFLFGHLPEAMAELELRVRHLATTQSAEGGWRYESHNSAQADLGQPGDAVLGTCAHKAATLLRFARLTGDEFAWTAGEKALRFMERFRVPRGGQTWECPMYEPDILAAAYTIAAYVDAFRITGNLRWLQLAVYWAETGVPFIYQWTLPDRPMMLGATIPVFGSTFYSHSWLATPVQWCGLVYAYHVGHLANELENVSLSSADAPLPLSLNFNPGDWKRLVELITVSGMHQQFDRGDRIGCYPDSISKFEQRNPAFLNPEDILVNVLALKGYDPDVKSIRVKTPSGTGMVVISSGAQVQKPEISANRLGCLLSFYRGESSHGFVAGIPIKPREILVGGNPLSKSTNPVQQADGWWWDAERNRIYAVIPHPQDTVRVEIFW